MKSENGKERFYPGSFKQTVVEDKLHSGLAYRAIGRKYNVPHNLVMAWMKKYLELGVESLYVDNRGAPGVKRGKRKASQFKQSKNAAIRRIDAKLKALEKHPLTEDEYSELLRLRMENEYLKKLRALVQE